MFAFGDAGKLRRHRGCTNYGGADRAARLARRQGLLDRDRRRQRDRVRRRQAARLPDLDRRPADRADARRGLTPHELASSVARRYGFGRARRRPPHSEYADRGPEPAMYALTRGRVRRAGRRDPLLLAARRGFARSAGQWFLPGGLVEPGESPDEGARPRARRGSRRGDRAASSSSSAAIRCTSTATTCSSSRTGAWSPSRSVGRDQPRARRRAVGEGARHARPAHRRGDGADRRRQDAVHDPGIYDLEVDTSTMTPEQCASRSASDATVRSQLHSNS